MQTSQITKCIACNSLKELYQQIEDKIYFLTRSRRTIEQYGLGGDCCEDGLFKTLLRYKNIIQRKIYNNTYLDDVDVQNIIQRVTYHVNQ